MSRIRSIKPEFWPSAQVMACSRDARLLFIGMWNFCDDAGRHRANLATLKAEVFPGDDCSLDEISFWIEELCRAELIDQYAIDGKSYWHVTGWRHQRIDKPQPAKYPPPPSEIPRPFPDHSQTIPRPFPPDTIRYDPIRKDPKGSTYVRTYDRTSFLSDGGEEDTDWGVVREKCGRCIATIQTKRQWKDFLPREIMGPDGFYGKLIPAVVCVVHGILPKEWLLGVIDLMLEGDRKENPTAWLGKVLAARALEDHGVDWDSYRRAIKIPEKFFETKEPTDG